MKLTDEMKSEMFFGMNNQGMDMLFVSKSFLDYLDELKKDEGKNYRHPVDLMQEEDYVEDLPEDALMAFRTAFQESGLPKESYPNNTWLYDPDFDYQELVDWGEYGASEAKQAKSHSIDVDFSGLKGR